MIKIKPYINNTVLSIVIFILLLIAIFLSSGLIQELIKYSLTHYSINPIVFNTYFNSIIIFLVFLSIFISYTIYLSPINFIWFKSKKNDTDNSSILSKEQFKDLYDDAPVPYITLDKDAKIENPNKSALRFFGVKPEEINNKNFFSYLSGEDQKHAEMYFQYYKSHIPINKKEVELVTKSGKSRLVELSIFQMSDFGTFSNTGVAMIYDITEQKLLDKAKTEFVSLASHQLKSPLATTKWLTEMLMSRNLGELSQKQVEYLDKLHIANEDMIELVDLLLNVSRTEMGSLTVDIKETNVEALTESILEELTPLISKKGLNIVKQYNSSLQNIESDPKLLRIVIQNFISNAVKYTPTGGTITITFDEKTNIKQIIVSDTGLGIPKDQQDLVFSKLFRAANIRTSSTSQGTGLGLYLVKSIVASINGNISFVSEENKGSIFTITLNY